MTGVVLAGGLSSRLGQDKTCLRLHGLEQPSVLERTFALLGEYAHEVVLSCRTGEGGRTTQSRNEEKAKGNPTPDQSCDVALRHVRRVVDKHPGIGPLGGLHACLAELVGPILVLSCDMPFMNHSVLSCLVRGHAERPASALMSTFQQIETGYIEALVAIYESACLPFFEDALRRGVRQISLVIPEERQHRLPYSQEQALPFFNVNYPSDLALARQVIKPS